MAETGKKLLHRDQWAVAQAHVLTDMGFYGESEQLFFAGTIEKGEGFSLRYWTDEKTALQDRFDDYLAGVYCTKPLLKFWHNRTSDTTQEGMLQKVQQFSHDVFSDDLAAWLEANYQLERDTALIESFARYQAVESKDAIDVRFVTMLIADALFTRRISSQQFEVLKQQFGSEENAFTLPSNMRTWSGFMWYDEGEWKLVKGSYYPYVFDERLRILSDGKAVTPLFQAIYDYSARNQEDDFVGKLQQAFSEPLLELCRAIAEFPHAAFEQDQVEAFKALAADVELKEKKAELEAFDRIWGITQ